MRILPWLGFPAAFVMGNFHADAGFFRNVDGLCHSVDQAVAFAADVAGINTVVRLDDTRKVHHLFPRRVHSRRVNQAGGEPKAPASMESARNFSRLVHFFFRKGAILKARHTGANRTMTHKTRHIQTQLVLFHFLQVFVIRIPVEGTGICEKNGAVRSPAILNSGVMGAQEMPQLPTTPVVKPPASVWDSCPAGTRSRQSDNGYQ